MRTFRDPTVQFCVALITAPLLAITGSSIASSNSFFWGTSVGWFLTVVVIAYFAWRSVRHQWRSAPKQAETGRPDLAKMGPIDIGLLLGITFVAVLGAAGAVVALIAVVMTMS